MSGREKAPVSMINEVRCPSCKSLVFPDLNTLANGANEVECDVCYATIGFSLEVDIDGVFLVEEP